MKKLLALIVCAVLLLTACSTDTKADKTEITVFHATDMHYISQQLTDNSDAFVQMILDGDGKMTHLCEQITDAFVEEVIGSKPDALLISGDITFNGAKLSHEDFILKLQDILDTICVFLVVTNTFLLVVTNDNFYEFSSLDDGITIPASLKKLNFPIENDCDAIIQAINGLSSKNELGYIEFFNCKN